MYHPPTPRPHRTGTCADPSAIRLEAQGDILLALPQRISITDIFVIHPLSLNIISRVATTAIYIHTIIILLTKYFYLHMFFLGV
jgi:hypothetical protein